jgi:autotransporter strand-loop-strand O-heptosyltransferase
MSLINMSQFFIGLGSGVSWVANALGKKVIMIAGFSEIGHEFECIRPYNKNVCHGCWNDPNLKFDKGDYNWCPFHKGTDRMFECQKSITAEMVIEEINKII